MGIYEVFHLDLKAYPFANWLQVPKVSMQKVKAPHKESKTQGGTLCLYIFSYLSPNNNLNIIIQQDKNHFNAKLLLKMEENVKNGA